MYGSLNVIVCQTLEEMKKSISHKKQMKDTYINCHIRILCVATTQILLGFTAINTCYSLMPFMGQSRVSHRVPNFGLDFESES